MTKLVGISGSLREASLNSALLRAAAALVPDGVEIATGPIRDIPLYDEDLETAAGIPVPVRTLKDMIAAADGLVIATPEYNASLPGVLKNAVDWLTRPRSDIPRVFGGLPVALMGASPAMSGTGIAQDAWLPVLRALGTVPWFGSRLTVPRATAVFDETGALVDDAVRTRVQDFVADFAAFAKDRAG